jgi:hypothetical protein
LRLQLTNNATAPVAHSGAPANLLMAAALALPGLAASLPALAQGYPDQPTIAYKNVDYSDWQKNNVRRMRLNTPLYYFYAPFKDSFAIEGSSATETLSGASPLFHSTLSGASGLGISEHRNAWDLRMIGFFRRSSISIQAARSTENDFVSNATTAEWRGSSEDNNTTLTFAAGRQDDDITATGFPLLRETRNERSHLAGITQVLTPQSVIQSTITYTEGHGYYNDPYKLIDIRPRMRNQSAWLTRLNRFFPGNQSALHMDYRYYRDTWGVEAHTFDVKYYLPLGGGWMVRPRARYYAQRAASFYRDVFPPPVFNALYSSDQRLSSFGAIDLGVKLTKEIEPGFTVDIKAERYEQRTRWRVAGDPASQILPLYANVVAIGFSKKF